MFLARSHAQHPAFSSAKDVSVAFWAGLWLVYASCIVCCMNKD